MTFAEAAILFNLVVLTLLWSGLSAWFGYRKFSGRIFRYIVAGPLLALAGALVGASIAGLVKGVDPFAFLQDSAKLRHVVTAGLVFGFLFALVTALIAHLRNREYRALTAHLEAEARQSEIVAPARGVEAEAAAAADRAALPVQHAGQRAAARGEGRARGGAPHRRPDPLPARRDAGAARRGHARSRRRRDWSGPTSASCRRGSAPGSQWSVDVPAALDDVVVPPGMLITLVENAIKHGIEPSPRGRARRRHDAERAPDGRLALAVADTGAGLRDGAGGGQRHRARQHPRAPRAAVRRRRVARADAERAARVASRASCCPRPAPAAAPTARPVARARHRPPSAERHDCRPR